ncbi:P-loop containing nucleoside triphosphate hydrolase protein [Amanita rubescens]|nr:P-loop containing nucleoside triphosphate hydrolase protein [Amanita rubescens]
MATPNVVIFGETGAGKSSLVNMIAGSTVAQISTRAVGCTFRSTSFPVKIGGKRFNVHDTAGLDEDTGISLLVFCLRGPKIKEASVKNWRLFWEIICQRRVPVILAVTGLENEEKGMDNWWTENEEYS